MATIKKAVKKAIAKKVMSKAAPMMGKMMKSGGTLSPSKNSVAKNISNLNKAKDGKSLGMESVKSGYDSNPSVTRADIISGAKKNAGKAKNGKTMMKMGASMKPKAEYGASMMKKGGKMKMGGKCKNGC
jgi:hypothetical protein